MNTTTTLTPGTTVVHDDRVTTELGKVKLGRSAYTLYSEYRKNTFTGEMVTEYHMVGPRGAFYFLDETTTPGTYRPVGLMSGPMVRQGNPVYITLIGDLAEFSRK